MTCRALAASLALAGAGSLAACSEFNLVPRCAEIGDRAAIALIPNSLIASGDQINREKVARIVRITDLSEVSSGYNRRTCRARFSLVDGSAEVDATFVLQQSEGVRNWSEITFNDVGRPDFDALVGRVQREYSGS